MVAVATEESSQANLASNNNDDDDVEGTTNGRACGNGQPKATAMLGGQQHRSGPNPLGQQEENEEEPDSLTVADNDDYGVDDGTSSTINQQQRRQRDHDDPRPEVVQVHSDNLDIIHLMEQVRYNLAGASNVVDLNDDNIHGQRQQDKEDEFDIDQAPEPEEREDRNPYNYG